MARGRSAPGRLRGWGGVAGMAVACAITASLTLLPLSHSGGGSFGTRAAGQGSTPTVHARAEGCTDPEASPRLSGDDGPGIDRIEERGRLIAGAGRNGFRWGYRNPETRELEGFDIDPVRAMAQDILSDRNAVIFRAIPTDQRVAALENDRVDVVVRTMTINCERLEQVSISTAYYGVAAKQGAEDLVARVDKVLADYREGGDDSPWMVSCRAWPATGLPGITGPPAPGYLSN
ncbi:transporter substrate-binding domain-containing protein [Streptomyces fulvorobeus]|uniref:ABC-type amino acid transport substrate-binding protein n=1 Tax=Streptomyces fulvorobeus TaxID=284028 RepID=A0A7J0C5N1_9ACTN|nr:transporter substrate-binding domain-containing protein [Streptomyces fulvorobeus]NYE40906.1 ABC-type amino acid transport substrate-binding protein [Streptomyces fulvorobeus]GFM97223.1 hypothetical protein Sfulv_20340 [Streptomyces fulvorobeus]